MNMKMEEQQEMRENDGRKKKSKKKKEGGDDLMVMDNDSESVVSGQGAPSEYEQMLQKYEAEVRNHIKIEQQLKLHIECV